MPFLPRCLLAALCFLPVGCGGSSSRTSTETGAGGQAGAGLGGRPVGGAAGAPTGGTAAVIGGAAGTPGGNASSGAAGAPEIPPYPRLHITGLAHGSGSYVATAEIDESDINYHGAIYRSADGFNWMRVADELPLVPARVAYGNGRFVAIGTMYDLDTSSWSTGVFYSDDGVTWSDASVPANFLSGLAFGLGVFVSQGDQGHLRSEDGTTWTTTGSPAESPFGGFVGFAAGRFLSCLRFSCLVGNGDDWQPVTVIPPDSRAYTLSSLRVVNDAFLGSAYYDCCFGEVPGTARWRKLSSPNGVDWTLDPEELTSAPPSIAFDDGSVCIAFSGPYLLSGPNCDALTTTFADPDFTPDFIVAQDGRFLVGGSGGVVSSNDGRTWFKVLGTNDAAR